MRGREAEIRPMFPCLAVAVYELVAIPGQSAVTACVIIALGLFLGDSQKSKQKRAMMAVGAPESPTRQMRFDSTIECWWVQTQNGS